MKVAYTTYRQGAWEARLRYANQQWLDWDADRRMFRREVPKDPWVPMPNINRFGPWIDGIASNFSGVPEIEALPIPLDDPINMGVADIANKLCDHAIKDNALRSDYGSREDRSSIARQMFTLTGCVFARTRLENRPIGEKPVQSCTACNTQYQGPEPAPQLCPNCAQGEIVPQQNDDGTPMMEPVTEARVIVDIDDPVWYSPRPGATSMDNSGWMFCARRMMTDEVFRRTGLEAQPDGEYPDGFNTTYQNELVYWYLGYAAPQEALQESCLLVEFWCEPGHKKEFPEGCYAVYFNGKVQAAYPWSYLGPVDHPITKADFEALPGIFFPRAKAFDLCEIQNALTRLDSMIELHVKTNAVEPIVIDENTIVSEITGRADKIVRWRSVGPGSKEPHRMQHGSIDPAVYERVVYLESKGDAIANTYNVMRGEEPDKVVAASAISQLRGQAELQFASPVKNWNNFWKEVVRKCLFFYQKYPLDELVAICGQDKVSQINDFVNADLKKALEFIATSHGLPRTRDERRQEMMTLYDRGALDINDPAVKQKIFELFGDTGMMKNFNADATRARMNVRHAKDNGQPAMFRQGIDDPEVHNAIATDAAKNLDFDNWPPQSQQALLAYIQQVQGILAQQAMAMQAQQQPPQRRPNPQAAPQPQQQETANVPA